MNAMQTYKLQRRIVADSSIVKQKLNPSNDTKRHENCKARKNYKAHKSTPRASMGHVDDSLIASVSCNRLLRQLTCANVQADKDQPEDNDKG